MFAEKMMIETDAHGRLKKVPALPPNKRLETIFLVVGESETQPTMKRQPCSDLKDSVEIHGDIISSATESLWNLPK